MDMREHAKKYADIQRVVCAALRAPDGDVLIGVRHYSADMHWQIEARADGEKFNHCQDTGFVDQWGNYLTRQEAWKIAERQGQIIRRVGGDGKNGGTLYSENLY